jgi:signal transduction histidine kinase
MKRWPLRWKVAFYAAALAVVATIAGAATTWTLMRSSEIETFDRRLALDAQEFFRDVANFEGGRSNNRRDINEKFVPLALRGHLVEIRGPAGELLYLSPSLRQPVLADGIDKPHTRKINGRSVRVGAFHESDLTLHVGADMGEVNQVARDIVLGMFGAIPTVLLVVVAGGWWVARQAIAPVEAIRQAAAGITVQNLDRRLPVPPTNDEIAALIAVLNATFDRLQRSFEQSVRFSADASHQLKTPISILRAGIEEILTDKESPPKQQARAEELLHQTHQLTSVAENLLLLARADAGRLELRCKEFDLREVLDGVLDDVSAVAEPRNITLETDVPANLPVVGDRWSVAVIAENLMENAVKYNVPGGRIRVVARVTDENVEVTICNKGTPIPPEQASHIFERFFRARGDGQSSGHGLGLSIAEALAKAQGGDIQLVRSDTEWTEFRLRLPQRGKDC